MEPSVAIKHVKIWYVLLQKWILWLNEMTAHVMFFCCWIPYFWRATSNKILFVGGDQANNHFYMGVLICPNFVESMMWMLIFPPLLPICVQSAMFVPLHPQAGVFVVLSYICVKLAHTWTMNTHTYTVVFFLLLNISIRLMTKHWFCFSIVTRRSTTRECAIIIQGVPKKRGISECHSVCSTAQLMLSLEFSLNWDSC